MTRTALLVAGALALVTAARLPAAWRSGNALNHVSGTWMALADDLGHGTLYRPSPDPSGGSGATRYFPAAFAAHAALVAAGLPLLEAGYAASLAAALLLAAGLALLARREAVLVVPLAFAGFAGQHALTAVRGDLLAVALSAVGLAAVARGSVRGGRLAAAGAALALAALAKPTALTATGVAVAFLALRGDAGGAARLAALAAALAGAGVAATAALSGGHFLAHLAAVGGAGADASTLLRAPLRLADELVHADPAGLALAGGAAVALAAALPRLAAAARDRRDDRRLLPALWVAASWAGVLAVLASPGTGVNHLLELEVASALLLGASLPAAGRAGAVARGGAALAGAAGLVLAVGLWRADLRGGRLDEVRALVRALPPGEVISEDPLVPLLAGASPRILDPFALRVAARGDPARAAPLAAALRAGTFPAVVLFADLDDPRAAAWYAEGNLGLPLVAEIAVGYRRTATVGRYHLYVPRAAARPSATGGVARGDRAR